MFDAGSSCLRGGLVMLVASAGMAAAEDPRHELLFDSSREGYARYRIPALIVSADGTVLAFCEGRKDGGGLTGNIDIVLKRSNDGGQSWGPLAVAADDGGHTLGNPCPVVERRSGRLWLALTRSFGQDTEEEIIHGTSRETTRVMVHSDDHGANFSPAVEITAAVKQPTWTWYGTGPGVGIQLDGGRLVIPSYHAEAETGIYRSHAIYGDDAGQSWDLGEAVGDHTSECQIVDDAVRAYPVPFLSAT